MTINDTALNRKLFKKLLQNSSPAVFGQSVLHAGKAGFLPWLETDELNNQNWRSLFISPQYDAPRDGMLLSFLAARIETHFDVLKNFVGELKNLDHAIFDQSDQALSLLTTMVKNHGWSFLLMSRLALLHTSAPNSDVVGTYISQQLELNENRDYAAYYFAFYDLFDTTEPFGVFEHRIESVLIDEAQFSGESAKAWVKTIYYPLHFIRQDFLSNIFHFQRTSLVDSLFLLLVNFENGCLTVTDQKTLPQVRDLREIYFGVTDKLTNHSAAKPDQVYRVSGWFCPREKVLRWRAELDRVKVYRQRQSQNDKDPVLEKYTSNYFPSDLHITQIAYESSIQNFSFDQYQTGVQFLFLRTFALFHCLLGGANLQDLNKEQAKKVLSYTENIALSLSRNEISLFYETSKESQELVVSFLALCLLFDKEPNGDVEFAMRMQFQETVDEWFRGDVIELLRWLSKQTPSLAHYVFRLCSTDFVDKLYLLVPTFEAGLELKEKILRWAAAEMNVEGAERIADQIAKERSIRKTRGERDDSRIFVDETWFNSWIAQNVASDLSRYTRSLQGARLDEISETKVLLDGVHTGTLSGLGGGHQHLLLQSLGRSYSEFCLHKVYGIRSFLGRRVLHGTLKGHLLKPVSELIEDIKQDSDFKENDFTSRVETWFEEYSLLVNTMQKSKLRLNSPAHPEGLIYSNAMSSPKKIAIFQKFSNVMVEVVKRGGTASDIASVLPDWCWVLLQVDLTTIQARYLPEVRTSALKKLGQQFPDAFTLSGKQQDKIKKIASVVEEQHRSFSTWFRRPETKLMSASVGTLVDTILTVLKKSNRNFKPQLSYEGGDVIIHGQLYHQIYDILEILIGNVEAWGRNDGNLNVVRKMSKLNGNTVLIIEVTSEYDPKRDEDTLRRGIIEAMANEDLDSVTDQTANTGIRRIRRILKHAPNADLQFEDGARPSFRVTLPIMES